MIMSGEEIIAAPVDSVWAALNDPKTLQACIPGCESVKQNSSTDLEIRVVVKLGLIKVGFNGSVKLSNLKPPHSYRIYGKGEGGFAGMAEGAADVKLQAVSEGTKLSYKIETQVGGKLAQLASRFIHSTAQQLASKFFARFGQVAIALELAKLDVAQNDS